MTRRAITWAATSVPQVRRQWANAMTAVVNHTTAELLGPPPPGSSPAMIKQLQRMQHKMAEAAEVMTAEAAALRTADMYWVHRDMVDVAAAAATTLPAWSPAAAAPSPHGLLCWAKPAGTVPYATPPTGVIDVSWDGIWWWTRPDGLMQIIPATKATQHSMQLQQYRITTPLWAAHTIMLRPNEPRTEEINGSEHAHPYVSVLGAAWLIMSQPNLAETRTTEPAEPPPPVTDTGGSTAQPRPPSTVTIVELRRAVAAARSTGKSGRKLKNRTWVAWPNGFWRQQAYGPGHSLRKPKLIAPYTKGPDDAPLVLKDKVNVWKR